MFTGQENLNDKILIKPAEAEDRAAIDNEKVFQIPLLHQI